MSEPNANLIDGYPAAEQIRDAWQDDLNRRRKSVKEYEAELKKHEGTWLEPYFRARLAAKTVARDAVAAAKAKMEEQEERPPEGSRSP